jgi:hypothetical protein
MPETMQFAIEFSQKLHRADSFIAGHAQVIKVIEFVRLAKGT